MRTTDEERYCLWLPSAFLHYHNIQANPSEDVIVCTACGCNWPQVSPTAHDQLYAKLSTTHLLLASFLCPQLLVNVNIIQPDALSWPCLGSNVLISLLSGKLFHLDIHPFFSRLDTLLQNVDLLAIMSS